MLINIKQPQKDYNQLSVFLIYIFIYIYILVSVYKIFIRDDNNQLD